MDIVVKLPDKDYQVMLTKVMLACYGCEIIELPKGHGRLIDVDEVIKIANKKKDLHGAIWNAPTIIEADEVES